ncbi:MAG TPA: UvrD-helicase domain-containing protein, partial [Anaerolineales bacterium]
MMEIQLTPEQNAIVALPLGGRTFLSGPAGTGKTAAAVARLRFLLDQGIRADSILLLTPQRFLHEPYLPSLEQEPYEGGQVTAITMGGLA